MLRVVILVVAVVVLLLLVRASLRGGKARGGGTDAAPPKPPAADAAPQPMVACAQCGVHLPHSEAVVAPSGVFCGEAHRLTWEREHPPS